MWKKGRPVPLPDGLMLMIPMPVRPMLNTRLLGWRTKLRMGLDWFRRPRAASGADCSSITVSLGYERKSLNHPLNRFGFLVPKRERRPLAACTWLGTKFSPIACRSA